MENIKYIVDDDNRFVDLDTGEIIDSKSLIGAKKSKRNEDFISATEELIQLGYNDIDRIVQYKGVKYPCVTIKQNYTYGKVFRVALREIMKDGKLSLNARAFIATFEPYISFPYNNIIVNSQYPSQKDIEDMLGLKRASVYNILKELETFDIVKRVKANNSTIIYFNPFLYASGGIIHSDTFKLFKNSAFNPDSNDIATTD